MENNNLSRILMIKEMNNSFKLHYNQKYIINTIKARNNSNNCNKVDNFNKINNMYKNVIKY